MPRTDHGIVADIIAGGPASIRRMTFGRFDEQYINATTVMVENQCRQLIENKQLAEAKNLLFKYYSVAAPLMYEQAIKYCQSEQEQINHTLEAIKEGIQLWLPQNTPNGDQIIANLRREFPIEITPVTYIDDSGRRVRTVKPVLIGSIYYLLLEKIGDDWGATSIPKRQHHGIPGKLTDGDKSSLPWRDQAFKVFGESEVRLLLAVSDSNFVASLINFPNSPAMCMEVSERILTAKQPTNIRTVVDYRKHAEIPGRAHQYFTHMMNVSGIAIVKGDPVNE